jgi:hypothetical protein
MCAVLEDVVDRSASDINILSMEGRDMCPMRRDLKREVERLLRYMWRQ